MVYEQFTWTNIILTLCVAVLVLLVICRRSSGKYPPGVKGFPFVGVLPYLLNSTPEKKYKEWSLEKHGPIMSVKLLGHDLVVLNTYDVIKQAFKKEGHSTSGRFDTFLFGQIQGANGITYIDYSRYFETQKAFGKNFVKSFGFNGVEDVINDEIDFFLKSLMKKTGKPVDIESDLYGLSCNVIHMLVFRKRYDYEELLAAPSYEGIEDIFGHHCKDAKTLFLIELQPWLHWLPPFRAANNRLIERAKPVLDWIKSHVEEVRQNMDKHDGTCFVSNFLLKQKKENEYSDEQLTAYLREWLGAIKNAYTSLRWAVLCAIRHPNYHAQVVNEIDKFWEKDNPPSSKKNTEMTITWAFINEVLRICSPLPKTLEHKTLEDVKLGDFMIPKNTELFGNLWGANHDPETWPEPNKFDPFRHIDDDGKLISPSKVLQFSMGPRKCLGKHIAKSMLFLTLTKLFHHFDVSAPDGATLPTLEEGYNGVTNDSLSFQIVLKSKS